MTYAEATARRLIFTLAASQEETITSDARRADAVMALHDGMERLRAISPTISHQVFSTEQR